MDIEVLMPAVGAGASEGKLIRWLKREGDVVVPGDLLAEIETDKAIVEIETLDGGTLQALLVAEGTEGIAVGSPIARLSNSAIIEPIAPAPPAEVTHSRSTRSDDDIASASDRQIASPLARRLAREHGLALDSLVGGSGPRGRIVKVDVDRAASGAGIPPDRMEIVTDNDADRMQILPHTAMRKAIARRLTESKQQIPHFYLDCDVRMEAMIALREQINAQRASHDGRISMNDMLVFVVAQALRNMPEINASWGDKAVTRHGQVDICVAVATDGGLITPIVKGADHKTLEEIAADIRMLAEKARNGRLAPEEYQGGSFTITNLGMYGIHSFSAIINPPQAAILSVGALESRPVVEGNAVVPGQVMRLTLSSDHRVIDGALAAQFMASLRALIESPPIIKP